MATLDDIVPERIGDTVVPYPIRGGILRGIRAFISLVLGGIVAALADGSLIGVIPLIPAGYAPVVAMALGILFQSIDKWLRERKLVEEDEETPSAGDEGELPTP